MKILSIDTTGAYSSVAIYDDGKITQVINRDDYSHLKKLAPCIKNLMEQESLCAKDLDAIAVSRGPGSFTGIRIGMATAKGLAQLWDKVIIEVPTLASFAFRDYEWLNDKDVILCPVFDAKRQQVYAGAYRIKEDTPVVEDGAYDLNEFLEKLKVAAEKDNRAVVFFGDGIASYKEILDAFPVSHSFAEEDDAYQTAEGVSNLGAKLLKEEKYTSCFEAKPEYLRAAEAERKLAEKIKADSEKFGTNSANKYGN